MVCAESSWRIGVEKRVSPKSAAASGVETLDSHSDTRHAAMVVLSSLSMRRENAAPSVGNNSAIFVLPAPPRPAPSLLVARCWDASVGMM